MNISDRTTFLDTRGHRWRIKFDCRAVGRCRRDLGIDLLELRRGKLPFPIPQADGPTLEEDWARVVAIVFCSIAPQAVAAGVSAQEFGGRVADPDCATSMAVALTHALADVLPPERRPEFRKLFERSQ